VKDKSGNTGMIGLVLGIIGVLIFGAVLIVLLIFTMIFGNKTDTFAILDVVFFIMFGLSMFLLVRSIISRRLLARIARYNSFFIGGRTAIPVSEIANQTGFSEETVRGDMRKMKQKNMHFDLYIDAEETTVMRGMDTYKQYLTSETQRKLREKEEAERQSRLADPAHAPMETFKTECAQAIERIRAANLILPGDDISVRLAAIESTLKRMLDHVQKHPDKLSETRKLMSSHLPKTLNLVDKYCQYDVMEYQTDTIKEAKTEIEKALDDADAAFKVLLDKLYRDDTLDVITDAEVLRQTLELDGLTGNTFDINKKS